MHRVKEIVDQIRYNCNISGSILCGDYSICTLVLRLRDLYKWEKGLNPWQEEEPEPLMQWIEEVEEVWDDLMGREFKRIEVMDMSYDPFDCEAINRVLSEYDLYYGAGLTHSLHPTFFVGVIEERHILFDVPVTVIGEELARDLFTSPAFCDGREVVVRRDASRFFIWDQLMFIKKSQKDAMDLALSFYGVCLKEKERLKDILDEIVIGELPIFMYHEIGSLKDNFFPYPLWKEMIKEFNGTSIELFLRALKDVISDISEFGTLSHILREKRVASLAFYVGLLDGLRRRLFHEIVDGFKLFKREMDWVIIEEAIYRSREKVKRLAGVILDIYLEGRKRGDKEWLTSKMKKIIIPFER